MRDFRVLQARAVLKVSSVTPIRDFSPPSVLVFGSGFDKADEVVYNGEVVDEFVIADPTRILAKLPEAQVGRPLLSISVLAPSPVINQDAAVMLGLRTPCKPVEGIDRLVQNFLLTLMTTPGSDVFDPTAGGGAQAIIGRPVSAGGQSAMADLTLAVNKTRQQIMQSQARNPKIPAAERLTSAAISSIAFDDVTTTLSAVIDLRNAAGDSALLNVG